jgi:hypothetical protein
MLHVLALRMLADRRRGHAIAHRVEPERHRPTRTLQDAVGHGLQTARHPEAAEAFWEVHPRQAGVVTGAEILRDGHFSWVVVGDHAPRQLGDPFGISVIAHASHDRNSTPVENQRDPLRDGGAFGRHRLLGRLQDDLRMRGRDCLTPHMTRLHSN